jgi:glycosyltransferase involved in cell wall biosynthesis
MDAAARTRSVLSDRTFALNMSSSPLRVAHVGEYAQETADGVHRTILGLLKNLPNHGIAPELWTLSAHASAPRLSTVDGTLVFELPSRERPLNLGPLPKVTRRAIAARSSQVDLVHFHSVFLPQNVWAARLLDIPYVITPNGGYAPEVLGGRNRVAKALWFSAMERTYLRSAAAIHAVSLPEKDYMQRLVNPSKIFVVPNAVDDDLFLGDIRQPHGRDLLFLGRLAVHHKGLDLLLQGFALSVPHHDSRLIVAGPDWHNGQKRCERLITSLRIEPYVMLRGPIFGVEKRRLLEDCYALVQPSRWEGLPFSVLEALAIGRPVVITERTNVASLVQEHRAGIIVDAHPEAISAGIRQLLDLPPSTYEEMCNNARQLVRSHFTWQESSMEMAKRYRQIARRDRIDR